MQRAALPQTHCTDGTAAEFRHATLRDAIDRDLLNDNERAVGFVNIDGVRDTVGALQDAFPEHFRHTFAAKANSLRAALRLIHSTGIGCEVASPGELEIALDSGFATSELVYDEPAKTPALLQYLLANNIAFNIDNFQELERVVALYEHYPSTAPIGFRINPQVGSGTIGAMSTATQTSKFGFALRDTGNLDRIINAYQQHAWLTSIHTHVGSQGCPLELMVEGVRRVAELADTINERIGQQQILTIDIGGGLPVNFADDTVTPTFRDYADLLRLEVPVLFDERYTVKTEFGRSILAKNGFIAARVEYTKESGGRPIAITHAGAQTATRTAFAPELWPIQVSVCDSAGNPKAGERVVQDVAGPCCFAGDLLARERALPLIEPGDYVLLHDTGAYYFSNPFFYNNLPPLSVYGVTAGEFDCWRSQPSQQDLHRILS